MKFLVAAFVVLISSDICSQRIPIQQAVMGFRYYDQIRIIDGIEKKELKIGTRIHVPLQEISKKFLNRKLGTYQKTDYYGKTGINFDPSAPKATGLTYTVKEVSPKIKFKEKFPEKMRNKYNSYFPFKVHILPALPVKKKKY